LALPTSCRVGPGTLAAMPRTDRASRVIAAPVTRVFDALVNRDALLAWLPPRGMEAKFERFDPRPGGSYRLLLTYVDPADSRGKSSADSDIVEARYLDIISGVRVVQAVDFVSDDPRFAGTMTMTWTVAEVDGGTPVEITADAVPDGMAVEDHATGLASSLENLDTYVCSYHLGSPIGSAGGSSRRCDDFSATDGDGFPVEDWTCAVPQARRESRPCLAIVGRGRPHFPLALEPSPCGVPDFLTVASSTVDLASLS
jgi:uncharacterized protein YndB with AHSA1/START domain